MEFKLEKGPWAEISSGMLEDYEFEVLMGKNSQLLSLIYEINDKGRSGAVINAFKVLYAKGDLSSFIEHIPKNAIGLTVHSKETTHNFFLAEAGVEYAKYHEESVKETISGQLSKLEAYSKMLMDVSKAYDLELVEIEECGDEEKAVFFSLPLLHLLATPTVKRKSSEGIVEISHGEIQLGVTKAGNVSKEPFDFFYRTLVYGTEKPGRLHVLHIIAESAMLSGIPLIIVDWEDGFRGLHLPNPNEEMLKKFKVDLVSAGFPIKIFKAGEEIKAQVDMISAEALTELFGFGNTTVSEVINQAFKKGGFSNLKELLQKIQDVEETAKITPFKKREAQRLIELIELIYPGLLADSTPVEEITAGWSKGISRANILSFSREDKRKNLLVLQAVLNALGKHLKEQGKREKLSHVLINTASNETIPSVNAKKINEIIAGEIEEIGETGCAIILDAEDMLDISKNLKGKADTSLGVISKNDVGVVIQNRKNYRVLMRPGLSDCCYSENKKS